MMIGEQDHPSNFVSVDVDDYQTLTEMGDHTSDVIMCLDSTLDTISTLIDVSDRFSKLSKGTPSSTEPRDYSTTSSDALKAQQRDVMYLRKSAEALMSKVNSTRSLVRL